MPKSYLFVPFVISVPFPYADKLEEKYKTARAAVDLLTPALLAKAFRGELVSQDPNDEPASVLLERIKADREAAAVKGNGKRQKNLGQGRLA